MRTNYLWLVQSTPSDAFFERLSESTALPDALEMAAAVFSTAAELCMESLSRGEEPDCRDAIRRALDVLAPDEDQQVFLWAATSTAEDILDSMDAVVLSRS